MTAQSRTNLKTRFENGDTPQQTDYGDLIDSFVSLVDTTAQTLASNLIVPTLVATEVSAQTLNIENISVSGVNATQGNFTTVSGATINGATVNAVNLSAQTASIGALTLTVATTVAASGGAGGAVPTSADGFLTVTIGGNVRYVPYFKVK